MFSPIGMGIERHLAWGGGSYAATNLQTGKNKVTDAEPVKESYADKARGSNFNPSANYLEDLEGVSFNDLSGATPLVTAPPPQIEGGNLAIVLDEDEYSKGVRANQFSVIGRVLMQRGNSLPNTMELRRKLETVWGLSQFRILPIGRGFFHIF